MDPRAVIIIEPSSRRIVDVKINGKSVHFEVRVSSPQGETLHWGLRSDNYGYEDEDGYLYCRHCEGRKLDDFHLSSVDCVNETSSNNEQWCDCYECEKARNGSMSETSEEEEEEEHNTS